MSSFALCFRAPGRRLCLGELLARAARTLGLPPGLISATGLRVDGRPASDPAVRVPPGGRVELGGPPLGAPPISPVGRWALVPSPPWPEGHLEGVLDFCVAERRGDLALIAIEPAGPLNLKHLRALARLGMATLGDPLHGGILAGVGLALAAERGNLRWPSEPAFPPSRRGSRPRLRVSKATARVLAKGHPWILPDRESGDPGRFAPGTLVEATAPDRSSLGLFRVDGTREVSARRWSQAGEATPASVEARVARAMRRRRPLLAEAGTSALRLVHGEADGLGGLFVERLGPLLRVLCASPGALRVVPRAVAAILGHGVVPPEAPVVCVYHPQRRPRGALQAVRLLQGELTRLGPERWEGRHVVCERGLRFWVDPGLGDPARPRPGVGLFTDQRENRARCAALAGAGAGRWLNLFAHTGAFSVSLLAAGAGAVTSVDLSAPYLEWLEANLALNGLLDGRHRSVRGDARRFLGELSPAARFDGIILDPPTAARAGQSFWSARKGVGPLLETCLAHLDPGGWILACRNDRKGARGLDSAIEEAARAAGRAVLERREAGPGPDFPALDGFPEGRPFAGVLVRFA